MTDIQNLEEFYKDKQGSLVVTPYATIEDLKVFSDAHLHMAKHNEGKPLFDVYTNRLIVVMNLINKLNKTCLINKK